METTKRQYRQSDELVATIQQLADLAGTNRTTVVEMAVERLWEQVHRGSRSREPYEVRHDLMGRAREIDDRRQEAATRDRREGQKKAQVAGTWAPYGAFRIPVKQDES